MLALALVVSQFRKLALEFVTHFTLYTILYSYLIYTISSPSTFYMACVGSRFQFLLQIHRTVDQPDDFTSTNIQSIKLPRRGNSFLIL